MCSVAIFIFKKTLLLNLVGIVYIFHKTICTVEFNAHKKKAYKNNQFKFD